MGASTAVAAAASLVALAFALSTLERWLDRRRPYELAWTVALGLFTLAASSLWLGSANGWNPAVFRIFYLVGAIADVPILALGTVYLLGGRRLGNRWAVVVGLSCAFAAGVVVAAPLSRPIPTDRLPQGSEVFGPLPRALAAVASGAGATVIVVGAVASAWRVARGRRPGGRRLVTSNALIAGGTLVLAGSGLLNSTLGAMGAFAVSQLVGVTLLFAGFLVAATAPSE